jgi:hypothetical protein
MSNVYTLPKRKISMSEAYNQSSRYRFLHTTVKALLAIKETEDNLSYEEELGLELLMDRMVKEMAQIKNSL